MAEYQARHLRLALASHEPRRIALGMSIEAATAALGGPPAPRAYRLLAETRRWASQIDDRATDAYVALAEGTVALLCGRWRDAIARCGVAERAFRDDCIGASWEIGTAHQLGLFALFHIGHISEMRRRLARGLDEADRRGDLFAATELRIGSQPIVSLMDDDEAGARDALARAEPGMPRREITLLHWKAMQSAAFIELYAGEPARAVELLEGRMPALHRAFILRTYAVRAFATYLQLAAWLGAVAADGPNAARHAAAIERTRRRLAGDTAMRAVPDIAGAGFAVLQGDLDAAVAGYRAAALGFDALDMQQLASAARWRLGELLGGDAGQALISGARAALAAEGVVRPDRLVAALAPIAAGARSAAAQRRSRHRQRLPAPRGD
jgi:hypothetical protein